MIDFAIQFILLVQSVDGQACRDRIIGGRTHLSSNDDELSDVFGGWRDTSHSHAQVRDG